MNGLVCKRKLKKRETGEGKTFVMRALFILNLTKFPVRKIKCGTT